MKEVTKDEAEKAYEEVVSILQEYFNKGLIKFYFKDFEQINKGYHSRLGLDEKFGVRVSDINWFNVSIKKFTYTTIGRQGEANSKRLNDPIPNEDNSKQPTPDEELLVISYPKGAGELSSLYPTELFNQMFEEFKSYEPKYLDTTNHTLYFSPENAATVLENYSEIFNRYQRLATLERRKHDIQKTKDELVRLEKAIEKDENKD